MNLKSIEYFLTTVEEMNVTRAAERLFISQQALSSHLKRLEEEYGVRLFERKPSLRLTLEGEQMVFYGKHIVQAEANLRAAFSDISKNHRGVLRVGISRLRSSVFFPVIWEFYHDSHPNISIELINGNSNTFEELLQAGRLDLYIGVDVGESAGRDRIELTKEKVQCCFSEELLKEYYPEEWEGILEDFRNGADLRRILRLPFITVCQGNRLRKGIDAFFSTCSLPRYVFECDEQELVYELAGKGNGAGLLSPVVCWKNYHEKKRSGTPFYVFPVINEIPENTVSLVYRNDSPLPGYMKDFIQDAGMVFQNYSRSISRHFG
ncbi:MAG: LysR family transcriptional regulator [Sakamotonia sp.]|jgi:DNA-binding transcriptional LysR family regulator